MADLAGIIERDADRGIKSRESRVQLANQTTQAINTSVRTGLDQQRVKAEAQGRVDVMASSWLSTLGQLDQKKSAAKRAVENAPDGEAKKQALDNLEVASNARNNFMLSATGNGAVMSMLRKSSFIDKELADRIFNVDTLSGMSDEMRDQYIINMTSFHRSLKAEEGSEQQKAKAKIIGAAQGRKAALDAGLPLTAADGDPEERARLRAKGGVVGAGEGREELKGRGLSLSASAGKADLGRDKGSDIFMGKFDSAFNQDYRQAVKGYDYTTPAAQQETTLLDQLIGDLSVEDATAGWSYNLVEDALNSGEYDAQSPNFQVLKGLREIYAQNMKSKDISANTGRAKADRKQSKEDKMQIRSLRQDFGQNKEKKTLAPRAF